MSCETVSMRVPGHGTPLSRRGCRLSLVGVVIAVALLSSAVRPGSQVHPPPDVPVSSATLFTLTPEDRAWLDAFDRILGMVAASERR